MSTASAQVHKNVVTLKGSAVVVCEFFAIAVSSILYQRGVYPVEAFQTIRKYGTQVVAAKFPLLARYLKDVTSCLESWLVTGQLQQLTLVILENSTKEVQERWAFQIETDYCVADGLRVPPEKEMKVINNEIAALIRQITASVTYLPLIHENSTFDILAHADDNADVPGTWVDTQDRVVSNAAVVDLRKFTTGVHTVNASVHFKNVVDG